MNLNPDLLIPLIVTTTFGLFGWFVTHLLSSERDRAIKRRELRTERLIRAFGALLDLKAYSDPSTRPVDVARNAESALSELQLFGTKKQLQLLKRIQYDVEPLVDELQNDLRSELKLERHREEPIWIRFQHEGWKG